MTTLGQLAKLLEAELVEDFHDRPVRDLPVNSVSSIPQAGPGKLVFAEDETSLAAALASQAAAVLVSAEISNKIPSTNGAQPELASSQRPRLLCEHPRLAFARAAGILKTNVPAFSTGGVHPLASVAASVTLGPGVSIGAYAVLEDGVCIGQGSTIGSGAVIGNGVVVGADCAIYPRVVIYPGARIGDRVRVHAGAVLGSDGFGYVRNPTTGEYLQFPQQGALVIEDDVEIGANTTIDRGALEETRVERGAKIDNLVHVGHNVRIGENTVIAAQTGISGSSTIGKNAVLGGQVGIGDHASVGDGVLLGGQAGILPKKNLRGAGVLFWGTPAQPVTRYLRQLASLARLARSGEKPRRSGGEG